MPRETILIIGAGWSGFTLSQELDDKKFDIKIVSPQDSAPITPLLASAACGLFDFSVAEEPIRRRNRRVQYLKARVEAVDFEHKACTCRSACGDVGDERQFELGYDRLILAPGCVTNTFNTPGADEHAFFVRNTQNARDIQLHMKNLFELASLPGLNELERQSLLHIAIVGGGPTGVEVAAETSDLINESFAEFYPATRGLARVTIYDAAHAILSDFEDALKHYSLESFAKRGVTVNVDARILSVGDGFIETKAEGKVGCGMVIWTAGNKANPLLEKLELAKSGKMARIKTDDRLRAFASEGKNTPLGDVYALGDAADIVDASLPTTAEVAVQKARYLARILNESPDEVPAFAYQERTLVAYLGGHEGIAKGKPGWSGSRAWAAWRGKNLFWARSWRKQVLIAMYWLLDRIGGREIARF